MSVVRVECPHCRKKIQAPEKYRGKKIKCPGCKGPLLVPQLDDVSAAELSPAVPPSFDPQEVLSASPPVSERHELPFESASVEVERIEDAPLAPKNTSLGSSVDWKPVAAAAFVCLILGYFAGREHLKWEMKQAFSGVGKALASPFEESVEAARNRARAQVAHKQEQKEIAVKQKQRAALLSVVKASYKQSTEVFSGGTIDLTITNRSKQAVTRVFFRGVLRSPERSVPWAEGDFNFSISGGLEPGETGEYSLSPNMLSGLHNVKAPSNADLEVTIMDVEYFGETAE